MRQWHSRGGGKEIVRVGGKEIRWLSRRLEIESKEHDSKRKRECVVENRKRRRKRSGEWAMKKSSTSISEEVGWVRLLKMRSHSILKNQYKNQLPWQITDQPLHGMGVWRKTERERQTEREKKNKSVKDSPSHSLIFYLITSFSI